MMNNKAHKRSQHSSLLCYPRSSFARAAARRSIREVVFRIAVTSARSLTTDRVGMGDAGGAFHPTTEAALAVLRLLGADPVFTIQCHSSKKHGGSTVAEKLS